MRTELAGPSMQPSWTSARWAGRGHCAHDADAEGSGGLDLATAKQVAACILPAERLIEASAADMGTPCTACMLQLSHWPAVYSIAGVPL